MMRKLKLYLETSVWNFYFADDAHEKIAVTRRFFDNLPIRDYEIYASVAVLEEITRVPEERRSRLLDLLSAHSPLILEVENAVSELAEANLDQGIVPNYTKPIQLITPMEVSEHGRSED
jgi:hypothetical protein